MGNRAEWAGGGGRLNVPAERKRILKMLFRPEEDCCLLAPIRNEALIWLVDHGYVSCRPTGYIWRGRRAYRFTLIALPFSVEHEDRR